MTLSPFATIAETRQALRDGVVSPVELTERALQRIETIGRDLNAVVTITPERARREARQAEAELAAGDDRGPLHAVPYGVKDLHATAGDVTSWGAAPLRNQVFPDDAAVVERLSGAGGILTGKFAMSELAGGLDTDRAEATYTQPALNPWHRGSYCGGSTSGGSAAVAAGLIPYTIGSETWGSILVPAALTGLTGLRPTHGLVSRRGAMALSWTLDKLGPIAHTAEDCAVVLATIAGPDPGDPDQSGQSFTMSPAPANARYRLGVLTDGVATMQPAVRDNFQAAVAAMADICEVEELSLPDLPYAAVCWGIMLAEAASAFEDLIDSGQVAELIAPENRIGGFVADLIPARSYVRALRVRRLIRQELAALTSAYDAIVTPTVGAVAPPLGVRFSEYYGQWGQTSLIAAGNVAGLPAITVPTGFGDRGLPTAMQFMAGPFAENRLIHLAAAYQARTDWHRRHPAGLD